MIDLHTHSLFSDGELIPSELVRRMEALGYKAVAITDHVDASQLDFVVPRIVHIAEELNHHQAVRVIPGVELTHVPPGLIASLVKEARELGAALVVIHGESPVEPVAPGTNRAGIEAKADILAQVWNPLLYIVNSFLKTRQKTFFFKLWSGADLRESLGDFSLKGVL